MKHPHTGKFIPLPNEDLIYDACLILPQYERSFVTGYLLAVINCDFESRFLPRCVRLYRGPGSLSDKDDSKYYDWLPCDPDERIPVPDVLRIISDFCELPPMLPYIRSFVDALWVEARCDDSIEETEWHLEGEA